MITRQRGLSFKTFGLSMGAALAVPYVLIMFAGLLLVGLGTTRSWQAASLGIGWSTVVGFELGLLGIVIVGLAVAVVFVPAYNFAWRRVTGRSKTEEQLSQAGRPPARSRALKFLTFLFLLLPVILFALRALASATSFGDTSGAVAADRSDPVAITRAVNMGPTINTSFRDAEPSFTGDGQTMYFNCYNGDICVSYLTTTWEEGKWTTPKRVGAPISTAFEEVEPLINAAGDKLYFMSRRPGGRLKDLPFLSPFVDVLRVVNILGAAKLGRSFFGGVGMPDVYVSYLVDGAWSEPLNLNEASGEPPVNTSSADHCLSFSADGNEAFWASDRPGGFGGNDIWTSRRVDGKWTAPENLGANVNGPGDEHHSNPTPDGQSLYVTATRDGGYGGEDIYLTNRDADGKWGPLVNLGSLINGPEDDRCPAWTPDLRIFLFDSVDQAGFGSRDIWWVYFEDVLGNPSATVSSSGPY